jgi:hypothetical protein
MAEEMQRVRNGMKVIVTQDLADCFVRLGQRKVVVLARRVWTRSEVRKKGHDDRR